ncbi:RTA1 like protein-domain-containing protein [Aspergillus leporis]|uniref:RTA1 like protein-domain-containing protein n=1 Tax=Aspergillus leporis TaxID=41062 RepID=A0A5N5WLP3_9EURO|nr:RTA1 like protein-domain-containing protein [Aspergillus leporis]
MSAASQVPAPTIITVPCTLETCPLDWALVRYLPSVSGNALYMALFVPMFVVQIICGVRYRTWSYLVGMSGGLLLEIIGYGGRLLLHSNPFNFSAFLQYLICLTIGPAFITAAIYICFARVIVVYGPTVSRIKPKTYARIFITCDLLCLILQAAGGAITATAGQEQDSLRHIGVNVMIAGLASQVVSLGAFTALCIDYIWRLHRHVRVVPKQTSFGGWKWKGFLIGLAIATLTIFIRSIFRVAELNGGFSSDLANDEVAFMILEGAMMVIACGCLSAFHPGYCLSGQWTNPTSLSFGPGESEVVLATIMPSLSSVLLIGWIVFGFHKGKGSGLPSTGCLEYRRRAYSTLKRENDVAKCGTCFLNFF